MPAKKKRSTPAPAYTFPIAREIGLRIGALSSAWLDIERIAREEHKRLSGK